MEKIDQSGAADDTIGAPGDENLGWDDVDRHVYHHTTERDQINN